jgi:hypothetical protein
MKTRILLGMLAVSLWLIGLPAFAQAVTNSDCFIIYDNTGAFAGGTPICATEAQEEAAAEAVALFIVPASGFANTTQAILDSPTVLLEPDGSISDIFGVFMADEHGQCQNGCIFFISDAEAALFLDSFSSAIYLPEGNGGPFDATRYLDATHQRNGFTATFQSDAEDVRQTPEPATLALLGVGVLAMGFARRKSLRTTPR